MLQAFAEVLEVWQIADLKTSQIWGSCATIRSQIKLEPWWLDLKSS